MCGIAGIVAPGRPAVDLNNALLKMRGSLRHRGPDDLGLYQGDGVVLGHTRLSIIDIAGGHQPLSNEDGTIHLVVNGEIYNYKSLQQPLTSRGHHLQTQSDCEVILHLYEEEGERCLEKLEGMFALALWDQPNCKLLLARDRFGMKPLYVSIAEGQVSFASELTAIVKSGLIEAEVDPQALYSYMTLSYVPDPLSILKGIRKIRPAERLVVQDGFVKSEIYWKPRLAKIPRKRSHAAEQLAECLEQSVQSHLVADVPVASFLSGGIDSSSVVAMAQKYTKMETFCVSFPDSSINEAPIARRVASYLGTTHHEIPLKLDPASLLMEALEFMDEPFADSSALPTFAVCKAARQFSKVVLSGDGGDEVFGGYTGRYRVAALKAALPEPRRIASWLRRIHPWRSGRRSSLPTMLELAALPDEERYIFERQITSVSDREALFGWSNQPEYEDALRQIPGEVMGDVSEHYPVQRALWTDLMTSLPGDMLTKVDRMSMAHGLEVRIPFLDHRLVELSLSMPSAWLVSPWPIEGKRILRQAIAPLLEHGILSRPKQGFVVPLNRWLQDYLLDIYDDVCLGSDAHISKFFDRKSISDIRMRPFVGKVRTDIYALLILELWLRQLH